MKTEIPVEVEKPEVEEAEICEALDCGQPARAEVVLKDGRVVWLCADHWYQLGGQEP